jgi:NADPH:quinone reductase-like Zn-dependent oxidoreductase
VSGVVAAVAPGVNNFAVGDLVFGMPGFPALPGGYAEYVAASAHHFARRPATLDDVHAAAMPLAGLTAWQCLVDTAQVQPGQRVLIHAAAGGVGHLAVQIAKVLGAEVIGTASAGKHAVLRDLGADRLIDYRTTEFDEVVNDVDVVLDTVGGDYEDRSIRTLRPGGLLIGLTNPFRRDVIAAKAQAAGVRGTTLMVMPDHTALDHLARLADAGQLRPVVAETFPLADFAKAHELGESGRTTGKLVLTI